MKDQFSFGPFNLNSTSRRLFYDHAEVHITRSEYLLLRTLVIHRGEVVSRRQLMQAVWGSTISAPGSLDALVNTVRDKLSASPRELIVTIRGEGYKMNTEQESARSPAL